eukprot:4528942-Alexandrium_andersonii.AAC.1
MHGTSWDTRKWASVRIKRWQLHKQGGNATLGSVGSGGMRGARMTRVTGQPNFLASTHMHRRDNKHNS